MELSGSPQPPDKFFDLINPQEKHPINTATGGDVKKEQQHQEPEILPSYDFHPIGSFSPPTSSDSGIGGAMVLGCTGSSITLLVYNLGEVHKVRKKHKVHRAYARLRIFCDVVHVFVLFSLAATDAIGQIKVSETWEDCESSIEGKPKAETSPDEELAIMDNDSNVPSELLLPRPEWNQAQCMYQSNESWFSESTPSRRADLVASVALSTVLDWINIFVRLFTAQSEYAERLAAVVESENRCTSQMRLLIDQISTQQGKIVALEEANKYKDEESAQLKTLLQDLKKKSLQNLIGKNEEPVAAVVIMACSRPDYLERTVKSVLKYQRSVSSKFPLFISQDGTNPDVKNKAMSYNEIIYLQHVDLKPVATERPGEIIAYYKIARHYKWALDELFVSHKFNRVIILEDDMEIAPDFFDYFEATATLLDKDKTIMAVSSWNDNGQKQFVHDPRALYRSDFFPGLGWMLTKSTWDELSPKWPKAYP
ncbi:hypothetical protein ZIOFF_059375 [Zingiber officinale]|uniref:Alpha-1,3-mannosyl-glycoprotein 2-beta-N-acetylglucosaminyltransferase n=1 Tax=Zingiber officinale TaxID=94328 RepID=A0A8J5F9D6_ZINOF|nr:hypothetical protein ZIOFF_059375 [Zingiber officinale]